GAAGWGSTASTGPRPSRAHATARIPQPEPMSSAGPGGRVVSAARHIAVVGWAWEPNAGPASITTSRTAAGAGTWRGERRYQPATISARGSGGGPAGGRGGRGRGRAGRAP